jgi:hypothetical protein
VAVDPGGEGLCWGKERGVALLIGKEKQRAMKERRQRLTFFCWRCHWSSSFGAAPSVSAKAALLMVAGEAGGGCEADSMLAVRDAKKERGGRDREGEGKRFIKESESEREYVCVCVCEWRESERERERRERKKKPKIQSGNAQ